MQQITVSPCAKINIGLYITEKRSDGYHNLDTVFYPIPLKDELTLTATGDEDELLLDGFVLEGEANDNLVMKALRATRQAGYKIPPMRIELRKCIPSGAGLGGGSSDAAYTVRALNALFHLGLSRQQIADIVAPLGADCAFFAGDTPMHATGIGDMLTPIALDLSEYYIVLIKPSVFVSTKDAYRNVRPAQPEHDLLESITLDIKEWQKRIANDFEAGIFPAYPAIAEVKQQLLDAGALYAAMSGSGSSVFGIFDHPVNIPTTEFIFSTSL